MDKKLSNVLHIRNLIVFAVIDNDFSEAEMNQIVKISNRLGVYFEDIEQIFSDSIISIDHQLNLIDKIEQLSDIVKVIKADGKVEEKEYKLLEQIVGFYNLNSNMFSINELKVSDLKKDISFKIFFEKFKEMTERNLSEVLVDEDFDIRFPLYRKKLNLSPIEKSIYLFFLKNKEVESLRCLSNYRNWFAELYSLIPGSRINTKKTVENITCPKGTCFYPNIARIKNKIKEIVPKNDNKLELNYFILSDKFTERKYLPLENELITIQPDI